MSKRALWEGLGELIEEFKALERRVAEAEERVKALEVFGPRSTYNTTPQLTTIPLSILTCSVSPN